MSSQQQHPPLPAALVGRIFERLAAIYGSQRLAASWRDADAETVRLAWAEALGRFEREALAFAVREVATAHPDWPPTLGQFVALAERREKWPPPALPLPKRTEDELEHGRQQMARIREMLRGSVRAMP